MSSSNALPSIHPGRFLAETLEALGLCHRPSSRALGISRMQVSHLVRGARPVTAEMALLIGKALRQTPDYWLNLQMDHDLKEAAARVKTRIRQVKPVRRAA